MKEYQVKAQISFKENLNYALNTAGSGQRVCIQPVSRVIQIQSSHSSITGCVLVWLLVIK